MDGIAIDTEGFIQYVGVDGRGFPIQVINGLHNYGGQPETDHVEVAGDQSRDGNVEDAAGHAVGGFDTTTGDGRANMEPLDMVGAGTVHVEEIGEQSRDENVEDAGVNAVEGCDKTNGELGGGVYEEQADMVGEERHGDDGEARLDCSTDDDMVVIEEIGEDGDLVLRILERMKISGDEGKEESPAPIAKPILNMQFNSGVEFVVHMHRYGHSKGFGVTIRDSVKDGRKKVAAEVKEAKSVKWFNLENQYIHYRKIRIKCRKGAVFQSRSCDPNRSTTTCKTNCPFVVNACRSPVNGNIWKITKVFDVHNHDIDPELSRHLPRYRRICIADQIIAKELHKWGVGVANMFDIFVNQYKLYELVPFTESDLRNFIYFVDKKPLKDSDFAKMEVHFQKMREQSPDFFYEFDVGTEFKLKNVFWADSRCREAFKEFGDTVSFDTTFVSNRYKMPFAPIIGVNHYGKSMLFGCALIGKEDTESFSWVFRTWKKCMGRPPGCILTDQDKAIGSAVAKEFPGISHRWCIWHVMWNCRKHLGMLPDWGEISKKLQDILHDSFSIEEFEAEWHAWAENYGVGGNSWVKDMYKDRARWAPVYFKGNFWVGMSSTQRSEGMHHYLKGFVDINTCLSEFVERYGKAVCKRIEEECKDTKLGTDRSSRKTANHAFEAVFEKMYTRDKFLKVHDEMIEMAKNTATMVRVHNESVVEYEVVVKEFRVGWTKRKHFRVVMDRNTLEVKCDCRIFEFSGIMCAHMLRVFWEEETPNVPERYVCRRWRKDVPRKYMSEAYPMAALIQPLAPEVKRYGEIHKVAQEICVMVMNCEELKEQALGRLTSLKNELEKRIATLEGIESYVLGGVGRVYRKVAKARESSSRSDKEELVDAREGSGVKDPVDKRGRGRGQTKRRLSFADQIGGGKGRGRSKKVCKDGGNGECSGNDTPASTPAKDVQGMYYRGWETANDRSVLRHGFKFAGAPGNIRMVGQPSGWF